jgi:hypothetical protein
MESSSARNVLLKDIPAGGSNYCTLPARRVAVKKVKDTISANQLPSIQKHTKTKKAVEKEIIQFLNGASTKEGKSTKPG